MAFATETSEFPHIEIKPEALAPLSVGVASPLWGFYASAALSGVAYWWMTQWARPVNLEALFGQTAAPALQAVDAAEKVAATMVETLAPPELPAAPVGGEAAPVSPVAAVEAVADGAGTALDATTAAVEETAAAATPEAKPVAEPRPAAPKAKAAPPPRTA